jgi:hypothetical protein
MVADYSTAQIMVERDEGGVMLELAGGVAFSLCMWEGKGKLQWGGVEWSGVNDSVS